jgi:hypothetical protein
MLPTEDKLQSVVGRLQQIMRLQDYDIYVNILDAEEMEELGYSADDYGGINSEYIERYFDIYINKDVEQDWYFTLIHEMFEIRLFDFLKPLKYNLEEKERCINDLVKIFLFTYPIRRFDDILNPFDTSSSGLN